MTQRRKELVLERSRSGFAARMQRQRLMMGTRLAEMAARAATEQEATLKQVIATMPWLPRLWIAALIVVGKWGVWRGPGEGAQEQPAQAAEGEPA